MAMSYVAQLRAARPHGPYILGGWSMGGIVALEMAQQLRSVGEDVPLLIAIDSLARSRAGAVRITQPVLLKWFAREHGLENLCEVAGEKQFLAEALMQFKARSLVPQSASVGELSALVNVFAANLRALFQYEPKEYSGEVLLIKADQGLARIWETEDLGWRDLVGSRLALEVATGDHYSVLARPHIETVFGILTRYLEALGSGRRRQ